MRLALGISTPATRAAWIHRPWRRGCRRGGDGGAATRARGEKRRGEGRGRRGGRGVSRRQGQEGRGRGDARVQEKAEAAACSAQRRLPRKRDSHPKGSEQRRLRMRFFFSRPPCRPRPLPTRGGPRKGPPASARERGEVAPRRGEKKRRRSLALFLLHRSPGSHLRRCCPERGRHRRLSGGLGAKPSEARKAGRPGLHSRDVRIFACT